MNQRNDLPGLVLPLHDLIPWSSASRLAGGAHRQTDPQYPGGIVVLYEEPVSSILRVELVTFQSGGLEPPQFSPGGTAFSLNDMLHLRPGEKEKQASAVLAGGCGAVGHVLGGSEP